MPFNAAEQDRRSRERIFESGILDSEPWRWLARAKQAGGEVLLLLRYHKKLLISFIYNKMESCKLRGRENGRD